MEIFNQIKKAVASFTLGALLFGFVTPVANAQLGFTDDAEIPSWAFDAIDELMAQGVVSGNDDGSFAPNRQLNRAEVSKIIVLASGVDLDTTGGPHFPDVDPGAWFYDYVETMYNNGWINGYPDGNFRPEVGINRAEIAKMVVNAFEIDPDTAGAPHFDDVTSGDWFYSYVETAYNYGLMRGYGDGTFGPADPVTRAQTIKIVYDSQLVVTGPTGPAEGTLEVTLSSDTPRGTNIPFNATSVPFTTVELTASDDSDVEISSLTFTRLGLGDNDDFDNVWLEIDGFKVGNDKSVNNDDIVELRFNPPVVIPAGQTVVADLVTSLDFKLNADGTCFGSGSEGCNIGHHNRFAVVSADDISSTAANVVGDFPIEGEEMEVADYQVSEVEFSILGSDTTVDVGDNFIEIGKYRMLNLSRSNKDVELRAVTFKNDGIAELEDVLENVALYVSGEQVSAETIIDGDYVTFRLDNGVTGGYILEDGDSRIFSIRADIVSAEKGDTIRFKVDNFEDVVGVEIGTSFGVKAVTGETSTSCTAGVSNAEDQCATLREYSIDAGDLNVSRDPSSLGNQQYSPGSNDIVFLTARLTVDQPLIVDGVRVHAQNQVVADKDSNGTANELSDLNVAFDNFRLFLNDKLIDSENDFSGTTADPYLDFNTTFEIAGTSVLKVVANIQDNASTNDKVQLFVAGTDFQSPEYISTGDQVTTEELLGSAQASFVEVEKSVLVISKSDGLASTGDKIVAGVDDVTFLEFVLSNNDSGDVNVTSVTVTGDGTGAAAANYANFTAAIFVDGTQQGSSKNLASGTGIATFNDLSVVIPSSAQKEFVVVVDTIEQAADSNPGSSVTANGASTEPNVAAVANVAAAPNAAAVASTNTITVGGGGTLVALAAGDIIVLSTDGNVGTAGAEIVTVASATPAASGTITVTESFAQSHTGEAISVVTRQYPATATQITVANGANFAVGDIIKVVGAASVDSPLDADATADNFCVQAISGNVITLGTMNAGGTACADPNVTDTLGAVVALGAAVTEEGADATMQFNVTAVDADNVENGQSVQVTENGRDLGTVASYTEGAAEDGNCNETFAEATTLNYLCGSVFDMIKSGQLSVEDVNINPESQVLVAGATDVEVLRIKLIAADDDIEVKDLYFLNDLSVPQDGDTDDANEQDITERVDFKLKDASGNLIQSRTMIGGKLHFELANQDRIRVPKDSSVNVSVHVDVRAITEENQTGKQLRLVVDRAATGSTNGLEADTAATGADLAATNVTVPVAPNLPDGEVYIAYRTKLTFTNATTQPVLSSKGAVATAGPANPIFRFGVTADAAYGATLSKLTFDVTSSAGVLAGGTNLTNSNTLRLFRYASSAYTGTPTEVALTAAGAAPVATLTFTSSEDVEAGATVYYELHTTEAIVDVAANDTDKINVRFTQDADLITTNVQWTDRSNSGAENAAQLNGFELTYPSDSDGAKQ